MPLPCPKGGQIKSPSAEAIFILAQKAISYML